MSRFAALGGVLFWSSALGFSSCSRDREEPAPPDLDSVDPPQHSQASRTAAPLASPAEDSVPRHMREQLERTNQIRIALLRGDLAGARQIAAALVTDPLTGPVPAAFRDFATPYSHAAEALRDATTLERAAMALGQLGTSCGNCHRQMGGPKPPVDEAPAVMVDVTRRMQRHQWAAERMWWALISGSANAWEQGTSALSDAPLQADDVAPLTPGVAEMAARVHLQAQRATALTPQHWGSAYGDLVLTCSACHEMTGVELRPGTLH